MILKRLKIRLKHDQYQRLVDYAGSLPFLSKRLAPVKLMSFFKTDKISWDPWILKDGDIYRLFYLQGDKNVNPFWSQGRIISAISSDMKHWKELGVILEPLYHSTWESGRITAGFTYKENGVYYLFYGAAPKEALRQEKIGLAISTDGKHWQRYSNNPLIEIENNNNYYGPCWWRKNSQQCRDPYLFKDPRTGYYYLFITTVTKGSEMGIFQGCIGLAVSEEITGPYDFLPPVAVPTIQGSNEGIFREMERPQVIYRNGKYHLFFSSWLHGLNPKWLDQISSSWIKKDLDQITSSSLYWYVSDKITGPFQPADKHPVVKGSMNTELYAVNFVPKSENSDEFYAYGWYSRIRTLGITPFLQTSWNSESIKIHRRPK